MAHRRAKPSLGSPPTDWTSSHFKDGGSDETVRLPIDSIGGPPPSYGEKVVAAGPLVSLIVCRDRGEAAELACAFADTHVGVRLALELDEADSLIGGAMLVAAYVPSADDPIVSRLPVWREERVVIAFARDAGTADAIADVVDAVVQPPWEQLESVMASLFGSWR